MADYTPRLKASYNEVVRPAMKEEFAYKNDMMIPKITKITLNMGIGETVTIPKRSVLQWLIWRLYLVNSQL